MKKLSIVYSVLLIAAALWLPVMAQKAAPQNAAPQKVDLKAKAVKYIEYIADWKFKKAHAMESSAFQNKYTAEAISRDWHGLMKKYGPFTHHSVPTITKDKGLDMVIIKLRFGSFKKVAHVYFDQNGEINGLTYVDDLLN